MSQTYARGYAMYDITVECGHTFRAVWPKLDDPQSVIGKVIRDRRREIEKDVIALKIADQAITAIEYVGDYPSS